MNTLIEFINEDCLDNLITCINYKVDKIIYFGDKELYDKYYGNIYKFVHNKGFCIKEIINKEVSKEDFDTICNTLSQVIEDEQNHNNNVFIDITGGEDIFLVSAGVISNKYNVALHRYDYDTNSFVEYGNQDKLLSNNVSKRTSFKLTIDNYIEIYGARIDKSQDKEYKGTKSEEFKDDVDKIYEIILNHPVAWGVFSGFISRNSNKLIVNISKSTLNNVCNKSNKISINEFKEILNELKIKGLIKDVEDNDKGIIFSIKDEDIKECLGDCGSVLEMVTGWNEQETSDEVYIGKHIDWDGKQEEMLVENEIDVISLKGNRLHFISCKCGDINNEAKEAMYELQTVADKFGGKNVIKTIVCTQELSDINADRAKLMNINVKVNKK